MLLRVRLANSTRQLPNVPSTPTSGEMKGSSFGFRRFRHTVSSICRIRRPSTAAGHPVAVFLRVRFLVSRFLFLSFSKFVTLFGRCDFLGLEKISANRIFAVRGIDAHLLSLFLLHRRMRVSSSRLPLSPRARIRSPVRYPLPAERSILESNTVDPILPSSTFFVFPYL